MGKGYDVWAALSPAAWATFRRCRFVQKTFRPYPCLVRIEPLSEEGGTLWKPYRGQLYDPAVYQFIEGG
jgi:hypothetical protein